MSRLMSKRRCGTRIALSLGLLAGLILSGPSTGSADDAKVVKGLRAGAATSNITPPLGELIVGGFAPFPAKHVHDDLHARGLVLNDGTTTIAIVLVDSVGITREVYDLAKKYIEEECQIPYANVLIAATHTHSGTSARSPNSVERQNTLTDYQQFVARRIGDCVRCAVNNLEPAQIAFGTASEPDEVFNRRWYSSDPEILKNPLGGVDKVRMNPPRMHASLLRPAGPVDPEICFLSVQSRDGRPISLIANYSLHYVGGVRGADISADYFAVFANRIAELLNAEKQSPPFVGILSNGTSGDCNNNNYGAPATKRYEPYEKMKEVAYKVADHVLAAHKSLKFRSDITLAAAQKDLTLKVRKPTPELLKYFDDVESGKIEGHRLTPNYATRVRALAKSPDTVDVPLQVLRIGDVGIAASPFETFAETGLEIKEKGPLPHTFTIELANGSYGYLPTPAQHELGGYETWLGTNRVETQTTIKLVDTLMSLFQQVLPEKTAAAK